MKIKLVELKAVVELRKEHEWQLINYLAASDKKLGLLINFGHSVPRCIVPYGANATIDFDNKKVVVTESIVNENDKIKQI